MRQERVAHRSMGRSGGRSLARGFGLAGLAGTLGLAALLSGTATPASAEEASVEEQIVDAFQGAFGAHPGKRANHAKGIVVEGTFQPVPPAASITRAAHLQGTAVPVVARFSNATGIPNIPDGDANANPHGLAVKFHLPDGSDTDIVINSLHFFPVATPTEFRDLLLAAGATKPDSPKPTKLDQFLASHPVAVQAGATTKTPASFATEQYFGINAFRFTNKAGEQRFIRYVAEPAAGLSYLTADDAATKPADFLIADITDRLQKGPVQFRLLAQVAAPEDPITDATKPWPDSRPRVELGTLTLTTVTANNEEAAKTLLFLPGQVTDGIEASDDPLIAARDGAYAVSFSRRSQ
ncbi:catalase family peroxidase [Azospirillum canadense]|uniref:catalase family peroxidase n=1 Tax=Azospirillum canadense TaxID=403962 RepID=UPI00222736BA|nr:catalase family peroxidase [Azospirillum canadense]MCW2242171.1 catalase [Azospirillum canadense]